MTNARNSNSRREGEGGGGGMWRSGMGSWREKMLNEMKWNYGILLREYMVWWATVYASFPSLSLTQSLPLSLSPSLSLCRLAMWPGCKCWNFKPLNVAIVFDERREDREEVRYSGWLGEGKGASVGTCLLPYLPTHFTSSSTPPPVPLPHPVPLPICQLGCK